MKRGVGRGAGHSGNGNGKRPPVSPPTVSRYMQPPPPRRTGFQLFRRILLGVLLAVLSVAAGIGGGSYLYFHQSVSAVRAHSVAVKRAQGSLDEVPSASAPATALVIGYDHRAGAIAAGDPSLSDTLMLIRADPQNKTISLLSFPRDLEVPIYCGHSKADTEGYVASSQDRINSAYSRCGPQGTILTIKHLTNVPINYLITVNFHGFKEVVNKLGGVWMDIDRRYYNKNTGASYDNYANIDLQPGYQRLNGEQALDFVRFRHTDSDLVRNARQQEFVRSFKEQVAQSFSLTKVPGLVSAITKNIEVGEGGGRPLSGDQVLSYALFAFRLPHGHLFQDQLQNVQCNITCTIASSDVQNGVQQFLNPDVASSKEANAAALGKKVKPKTLPPSSVSVTVLNGNGTAGAASNASYLLAQRGYKTMIPPNNLEANAPPSMGHVFHTKVYYDPAQTSAKEAAKAMAQLVEPADVAPLPASPDLRALDPGSMLLVVLGTTFDGTVGTPVVHTVPTHQAPAVRSDTYYGHELLDPLKAKVSFPLETPTVLERNSVPDTQPGDVPARLYPIAGKHKAIRLVFSTGLIGQYWGIEETDWNSAPALGDTSFRHDLGGREFDLYYNGSKLQMVVLRASGATYWVVNTLSDTLSNETMLAIAKGLKPLTPGK